MDTKMAMVINFQTKGPPSSPKTALLYRRTCIKAKATTASTQNRVTLNANEPGSTSNMDPFILWYTAAMVQAMPMPRNTLTPLAPLTLTMEASAVSSCNAAILLAYTSKPLKASKFWISGTYSKFVTRQASSQSYNGNSQYHIIQPYSASKMLS